MIRRLKPLTAGRSVGTPIAVSRDSAGARSIGETQALESKRPLGADGGARGRPGGTRNRRRAATPAEERENQIQYDIRIALGHEMDLVLYRNSTGVARHVDLNGQERTLRYGLVKGGADLVGMLSMSVLFREQPLVLARWFALEIKTRDGRTREDQKRFLRLVRRMGGFGAVVRSVDEARAALKRARAGACE